MGLITAPLYPARADASDGRDTLTSDSAPTNQGSFYMRDSDGNEHLIVPGRGFTLRVRLPTGEDQLWTPLGIPHP